MAMFLFPNQNSVEIKLSNGFAHQFVYLVTVSAQNNFPINKISKRVYFNFYDDVLSF